jgi:hypothetical protein
MSEIITGVMRGRMIELTADPGIADGQPVQVMVWPVQSSTGTVVGEARSAAGMLADDPHVDKDLDEIKRYRKSAQFREGVD